MVNRRHFTKQVLVAGIACLGLASLSSQAADLTERDAASGMRAALERGAMAAVSTLGRQDGFLGNDKVRIELPASISGAAKLLRATGQGHRVDELITAMNRAAEAAMPEAKAVLVQAVRNISVKDALQVVRGGDTAATEFFARNTRQTLEQKFLPIVTQATQKVALADKYNAVAGKAAKLGLIKTEDADVQRYVTQRALDGLYLMIGEEERKIRQDPIGTGSVILKRVFGAL